jgi:hypothetical protein
MTQRKIPGKTKQNKQKLHLLNKKEIGSANYEIKFSCVRVTKVFLSVWHKILI